MIRFDKDSYRILGQNTDCHCQNNCQTRLHHKCSVLLFFYIIILFLNVLLSWQAREGQALCYLMTFTHYSTYGRVSVIVGHYLTDNIDLTVLKNIYNLMILLPFLFIYVFIFLNKILNKCVYVCFSYICFLFICCYIEIVFICMLVMVTK